MPPMSATSPERLRALLAGADPPPLIDVRTPAEFREVHVEGAENVPLQTLDPAAATEAHSAGGPVRVLCRSGRRAAQAVERLNAAGVEAEVVEGGTLACVAAGLPVVRGEASVSLERQVRIAAGSLVAAGVALGAFVHPLFLLLPGFVGCGLVFSGLTDTCGMGNLLARMPWNRAAR